MPRPPLSLRGRALGYLARREHSRVELEVKLRRSAGPQDDVAALLDEFVARGWLSERRLVEQVVNGSQRFGAARVLNDLRRRGIDETLLGPAAQSLKVGELPVARAVWNKKFGAAPPADAAERARQSRFLRSRGFSGSTIARVLRGGPGPDEPAE
ncbi:MAG: recombination regulator RecX [Proteobacteria bacterium]|nr:recombination regulator RecX [Burkholderiales bacterium]